MNKIIIAILSTLIVSCGSTSIKRNNANDRFEAYKNSQEIYAESEEEYLILLENLERYPKEEELLTRKKILRQEIEQNRIFMLQSRVEFEEALEEWDLAVQKMETGIPTDSLDLRQIFGLPTPSDSILKYNVEE